MPSIEYIWYMECFTSWISGAFCRISTSLLKSSYTFYIFLSFISSLFFGLLNILTTNFLNSLSDISFTIVSMGSFGKMLLDVWGDLFHYSVFKRTTIRILLWHMYINVYSRTIHKIQVMEQVQVPISRWMDKENEWIKKIHFSQP